MSDGRHLPWLEDCVTLWLNSRCSIDRLTSEIRSPNDEKVMSSNAVSVYKV